MLRAPVLMRSLREGHGQKTLSLIKNDKSSRKHSSISTTESLNDEELARRSSHILFYDSNNKPGPSGNGAKLDKEFCIKILECGGESDEWVYYKDDEDRFTQRYTLKLCTQAKYKVSIEVETGVEVVYMKLGGIYWDQFILLPNPDAKSTKSNHTFIWCTDKMEATNSKYRTILPCVVKLKDHEEMEFVVMVKFYNHDKINHTKGHPLSFLSIDESEIFTTRGKRIIHKLLFN